MGPDQMKKIAAAASAGFAMQITAQTEDPASYDAEWAREMLGDLESDQGIADMANEVGVENIGPTPKQRSRIDEMQEQFPDLMNFDEEEPGLEEFDGSSNFDPSQNLEIPMDEVQRDDPFSPEASNSSNLIRLAAHLDSIGQHDMADELDGAAFSQIEEFLTKLPTILARRGGRGLMDGSGPRCPAKNDDPEGRGPGKGFGTGRGRGLMDGTGPRSETGECPLSDETEDDLDVESRRRPLRKKDGTGRPSRRRPGRGTGQGPGTGPRSKDGTCPFVGKVKKNASTRMAQVAMDEVGMTEEDIELDGQDDQSKMISFDPERMAMIIQTPTGVLKSYKVSGMSSNGRPIFEFDEILEEGTV